MQNDISGYAADTVEVAAGFFTSGSWQYTSPVAVATDGTYSIEVDAVAGEYDLRFSIADYDVPLLTSYFGGGLHEPNAADTANPGIINATATTDLVDQNPTLVAAGYITGIATSSGNPAAGVNVDAYDSSTGDEFDAPSPTDATGAYRIKVPSNTPLQVETDGAAPYEYQTWEGHNGCGCSFDPVTVGAGVTKPGINFDLLSGPIEILTIVILDPLGDGTFSGASDRQHNSSLPRSYRWIRAGRLADRRQHQRGVRVRGCWRRRHAHPRVADRPCDERHRVVRR